MSTRPKAIAEGKLFDGLADCYVLEDGRHLLSQRGIIRALTTQKAAENSEAKSSFLDRYFERLPENHRPKTVRPSLEFETPSKALAIGREGVFFVEMCQAYANAFVAGELHYKQTNLAKQAIAVLSALATVGIDALIDEATGHQRVRADNALERRMREILRNEAGKWELCFPESLVRALAPLYGIQYNGGKHPPELKRINGIIYDTLLGKELACEMRRRNVDPATNRHHQFLQDTAKAALRDNLSVIELLAKQSGTKEEFRARVDAHYNGEPLQLGLVVQS